MYPLIWQINVQIKLGGHLNWFFSLGSVFFKVFS